MAATATNRNLSGGSEGPGSDRRVSATVAFDASYPTGGYPVTASLFGLGDVRNLVVAGTTLLGNNAVYDRANSKIKVYCPSTHLEAANGLSLATDTVEVIAIGTN